MKTEKLSADERGGAGEVGRVSTDPVIFVSSGFSGLDQPLRKGKNARRNEPQAEPLKGRSSVGYVRGTGDPMWKEG